MTTNNYREDYVLNLRTAYGTISLGEINLNDLQIETGAENVMTFFEIQEVSTDLRKKIQEAIEIRKREFTEEMHGKFGAWSDKGVAIESMCLMIRTDNKKLQYEIMVNFFDQDDRIRETEVFVSVDLFDYENELKKSMIKAMIDKFF